MTASTARQDDNAGAKSRQHMSHIAIFAAVTCRSIAQPPNGTEPGPARKAPAADVSLDPATSLSLSLTGWLTACLAHDVRAESGYV